MKEALDARKCRRRPVDVGCEPAERLLGRCRDAACLVAPLARQLHPRAGVVASGTASARLPDILTGSGGRTA
eukprot:4719150-Prymnesium_polylepis.2